MPLTFTPPPDFRRFERGAIIGWLSGNSGAGTGSGFTATSPSFAMSFSSLVPTCFADSLPAPIAARMSSECA